MAGVDYRSPERETILFEPGGWRVNAIGGRLSVLQNFWCLVVYDVAELNLDFWMPNSLNKRVKSTAYALKTLRGCELSRNSCAFPSNAERPIPTHDHVIADFRNRDPGGKRSDCF